MAKTILIAEDEETLLSVLSAKLSRLGFHVREARDGIETIGKLRSEHPDLLLLDIVMPKLNGFDVLETMQVDPDLKIIPVIIISNSGQPVEIERAKKLGAVDYLVKAQFDPNEVVDKVTARLGMPDAQKNGGGTQATGVQGSSGVILIVEDDKFLRDLISQKLRKEGFTVHEAIDGEEGLRKVSETHPHLILLDLILPGLDGFEVLKRVKENDELKDTPVIILSNLGQREDVERGMRLGAQDFLIKAHFTPGEIIEKVRAVITQK